MRPHTRHHRASALKAWKEVYSVRPRGGVISHITLCVLYRVNRLKGNLFMFWRSVSVAVCTQSQTNRGMFHQRAPVLPARHIQDALLMWFSFEKNTRLVIVMTSPAVGCRRWLKSLFWLQEFCQWDARSWSRSLWSFWHPPELTNRPPSHPSTTCPGMGAPRERPLPCEMLANAASYCCSTFINILTDLTGIRELYKAIILL